MTWRDRAACLDDDPELFFPVGNAGPALLQIEAAKAVCHRCQVVETCVGWAMKSGQRFWRVGRNVRSATACRQATICSRPRRHPSDGRRDRLVVRFVSSLGVSEHEIAEVEARPRSRGFFR